MKSLERSLMRLEDQGWILSCWCAALLGVISFPSGKWPATNKNPFIASINHSEFLLLGSWASIAADRLSMGIYARISAFSYLELLLLKAIKKVQNKDIRHREVSDYFWSFLKVCHDCHNSLTSADDFSSFFFHVTNRSFAPLKGMTSSGFQA